jgi:hypothetical protein
MAIPGRVPRDPAMPAEIGTGADLRHYTGVVVIHGVGDEKRNETLVQIVDALTYWYNHEAGLALRPAGPGRMWLTTELTEDDDPDAPASRATLELVAPASPGGEPPAGSDVLLKFREVWWARSFGAQPLGSTIRWARVQFAEQMRHILLPPSHAARRAPARRTAQALTYRPVAAPDGAGTAGGTAGAGSGAPPPRSAAPTSRPLLRGALAVYAVVQYIWKLAQMLLLLPVLSVLLLVLGALQALSAIGILQSAAVFGFTALSRYVMLHWIASTQVYMRDYTRAAAIRQLFEREVDAFLRDERCDRVVVIAHSMGTVIAYEGLTTLRSESEAPGNQKPITFICLGQALRRVWLLPGIDVRRLRGVLPERVRWIHFWARYDPVTVGPLGPHALPRIASWSDASTPDPYDAICASLERCANVDVVNADSTLADHVTYWDNLEQVVGPIAHELVADHAAVERAVAAGLATPGDVLERRWAVAWRYTLALGAGVAVSVALLAWSALHPAFGGSLAGILQRVDWGGLVASVCPPCGSLKAIPPPPPPQDLQPQQLAHYITLLYLVTRYVTLQLVVVLGLAALAGTVAMQAAGWLVAPPSPFDFAEAPTAEAQGAPWVVILSVLAVVLGFAESLVFTSYFTDGIAPGAREVSGLPPAYLWVSALANVFWIVAFGVAAVGQVSSRRWGWIAWMALAEILTSTFDPFYRSVLLAITIAGILVTLIALRRTRQPGWYVALALALVMLLYVGIGSLVTDSAIAGGTTLGTGAYLEPLIPALVYGLWWWRGGSGGAAVRRGGAMGSIFALATTYLGLMYVLAVVHLGLGLGTVVSRASPLRSVVSHTRAPIGGLTLGDGLVDVAAVTALVALVLSLVDAARSRRWGWLAAIPLAFAALGAWFALLRTSGIAPALQDDMLLFSLAPLASALIYALWAGPARPKPSQSVVPRS